MWFKRNSRKQYELVINRIRWVVQFEMTFIMRAVRVGECLSIGIIAPMPPVEDLSLQDISIKSISSSLTGGLASERLEQLRCLNVVLYRCLYSNPSKTLRLLATGSELYRRVRSWSRFPCSANAVRRIKPQRLVGSNVLSRCGTTLRHRQSSTTPSFRRENMWVRTRVETLGWQMTPPWGCSRKRAPPHFHPWL